MLFSDPITFDEALESREAKAVLPTMLDSRELEKIKSAIRDTAFVSAKVNNAGILQGIHQSIDDMLLTTVEQRPGGAKATVGTSLPDVRQKITGVLDQLNYVSPAGKEGTIEDLRSQARQDLIVKTQVDMAHGYGFWKQGNTKAIVNNFPAYEFYRAEERVEPRDWPERWEDAGGEFYKGPADYPEGRMIALVDDDIWEEISRFGTPYPPFDYNSGMSIRPVTRHECIRLGVMDKDDIVGIPEDRNPGDDLQMATGVEDGDLLDALMDTLGEGYAVKDGILSKVGNALLDALTPNELILFCSLSNEKGNLGHAGRPGQRRGSEPRGYNLSMK
jgi:hypothetical protein